jgi:hypothetical protein
VRVSDDASYIYSLYIPLYGVMNNCDGIIMFLVCMLYMLIASCVEISVLSTTGYCGCSCSIILFGLTDL